MDTEEIELQDSDTAQELGVNAQVFVANAFRVRGYSVIAAPYHGPFDLLVNGKRVEVKVARKNERFLWHLNIHRHGKLDESNVDVYAILLDLRQVGKKKPLLLLRPAPIGAATIAYSIDTLLTIHNSQIANFGLLGEPTRRAT